MEELIEVLHEAFEDNPAEEAYVMAALANLSIQDKAELSSRARWRLEEMDRCIHCGAKLRYKVYYEPHSEIAYRADSVILIPQEKMTMEYCPNCEPDKGDF